VYGGYYGLERIGQQSFSLAPTVPFLASTKQQMIAKTQVRCAAMQMSCAHDMRLALRELTLPKQRMLSDEAVTHYKAEN
jgi:hypothetical protein